MEHYNKTILLKKTAFLTIWGAKSAHIESGAWKLAGEADGTLTTTACFRDIFVSPHEWCKCFDKTDRPCAAVKRRITSNIGESSAKDNH